MKICLILVSLTLAISCAKKIDHGTETNKLPPKVEIQAQEEPMITTALCKDVFMCPQQCRFNHPYKDEQEINDEYAAKGLLGSEDNLKALSDNQTILEQYNACLLLPANQTSNGLR